jgi:Transposase
LPKTRLLTVSSVLRIIGAGVVLTATPKGAADVMMSGLRRSSQSSSSADVEVVLGVDKHLDFHVAVALDDLGRRLGALRVPTTTKGYKKLLSGAEEFGTVRCAGVEVTSSYGAGLARYLTFVGVALAEVERPKRRHLRRNGKSDPLDAEAAARAVLAGETAGAPKSADGRVEMISGHLGLPAAPRLRPGARRPTSFRPS